MITSRGPTPGLKIHYRKDLSVADYTPLNPNPTEPHPVIPITGAGDMHRSVYDTDMNGRVDRVDSVEIGEVVGLQDVLDNLANQGSGGDSKEIITVTNNGGSVFLAGMPVARSGTMYVPGRSIAPRHQIIGLAIEDSNPGDVLRVQLSGFISLTSGQWDAVTDEVGGLSTDSIYVVNISSKLTQVAPDAAPEYLIKIGRSVSNTAMLIDLDIAIKL